MAINKHSIFNPRIFAFILAAVIVLLFWSIQSFVLFKNLDLAVLDTQFSFKVSREREVLQKGVSQQDFGPKISPDILMVGIDSNSLSRMGRWPWPRSRHADFLNSLSRIANQEKRERAVLLDIFFYEPSDDAADDALFKDAIREHGRLFLETTMDYGEYSGTLQEEADYNFTALTNRCGSITNVRGPWQAVLPFKGVMAPLAPFGSQVRGFGHAIFYPDVDEKYRRQALVARISKQIAEIPLDDLKVGQESDVKNFQRYGWVDSAGEDHTFTGLKSAEELARLKETILKEAPPEMVDTNGDGEPDEARYSVGLYQDSFIPSITLALALEYFNKSLADVEVTIGESIVIPAPQHFDSATGVWEPYRIKTKAAVYENEVEKSPAEYRAVPEIRIPIDSQGMMLINFMGPRSNELSDGSKTFPLRSYSGYATRPTNPDPASWVRSLSLDNKIIMAGAFSTGMADDEKSTPMGLMYGVELHTNALNTIIMDNFLFYVPQGIKLAILFVCAFLVAFYSARLGTPWAVLVTLVLIALFFMGSMQVFDAWNLVVDFSAPAFTMFFTLLSVIAYRVMTEEQEKKRIQGMFGKYVSKEMVDAMIASGQQPELGGVDKELTVLFSDIRGFTTLSESMSPQELVNHLNEYLTVMTDLIFEYKGTLDKYVGDEVMCFWGAPVPQQDHALLACKCALKQMEKLAEMNAAWPPEKRIDIGIGINSGIMTVGNMGSPGRLNYTLMGDNVNLGARLEGTNKAYYTHVIISEFTYGLVKDKVVVRELDNIRVKGKNKPVVIYELVDVLED